jgi:hypothetical protein
MTVVMIVSLASLYRADPAHVCRGRGEGRDATVKAKMTRSTSVMEKRKEIITKRAGIVVEAPHTAAVCEKSEEGRKPKQMASSPTPKPPNHLPLFLTLHLRLSHTLFPSHTEGQRWKTATPPAAL